MKEYTYKFADGTTSTVEVDDELYEILDQMDKDERNQNRRETRKHDSYEWLEEQCVEPGTTDDYFTADAFFNIENEELQAAIAELPPSQQDLLRRRFFEGKMVKEIAEQDGIASCTVSKKFARIYKKLENFLGECQFLPSPVAIGVGAVKEQPKKSEKEEV